MINHSLLSLPSQKIIEALSSIVAPNTLNIIDTNGIILASSDINRIGSFHSGGLEAVKTGKEVKIYPKDVYKYKGAKIGINTPIIKNNKIVGVIGIYGHPDEIQTISSLLTIISDHFIEQTQVIESSQRILAIKDLLTNIIVSNDVSRISEILPNVEKLNITFTGPLSLIILNCTNETSFFEVSKNLSKLHLLKNSTDLLLKFDKNYLLIKSKIDNLEDYLKSILDQSEKIGINLRYISTGLDFSRVDDLFASYNIAKKFNECIWKQKIYNAMNPDNLILIMFNNINNQHSKLCDLYISNLINKLDEISSPWVYPTIETFLFEDGKIQRMSKKLNIHKNSCIYRVNKIIKILKLENCNNFTIAYYFGIILQKQKQKDFLSNKEKR